MTNSHVTSVSIFMVSKFGTVNHDNPRSFDFESHPHSSSLATRTSTAVLSADP
jgi:hypothetical protein